MVYSFVGGIAEGNGLVPPFICSSALFVADLLLPASPSSQSPLSDNVAQYTTVRHSKTAGIAEQQTQSSNILDRDFAIESLNDDIASMKLSTVLSQKSHLQSQLNEIGYDKAPKHLLQRYRSLKVRSEVLHSEQQKAAMNSKHTIQFSNRNQSFLRRFWDPSS
eukprot:Clim_evm58s25 gene=Clim_evmTU58s25